MKEQIISKGLKKKQEIKYVGQTILTKDKKKGKKIKAVGNLSSNFILYFVRLLHIRTFAKRSSSSVAFLSFLHHSLKKNKLEKR